MLFNVVQGSCDTHLKHNLAPTEVEETIKLITKEKNVCDYDKIFPTSK